MAERNLHDLFVLKLLFSHWDRLILPKTDLEVPRRRTQASTSRQRHLTSLGTCVPPSGGLMVLYTSRWRWVFSKSGVLSTASHMGAGNQLQLLSGRTLG